MSERIDPTRRRVLGGLAAVGLFPRRGEAGTLQDNIHKTQDNVEKLTGIELDAARYEYFAEYLSAEHPSYKAYITMRENDQLILDEPVCVFRGNNKVRVQGGSFEFTLAPEGVVDGEMPAGIQAFLQFQRKDGKIVNFNRENGTSSMGLNYTETCEFPSS